MTVNITAKKIVIGQKFTDKANEKLKKLDRFFDEATATVKLNSLKDLITVELTLQHKSMVFRAENTDRDRDVALDNCIDTIIRKIRKNKTKLEKRIHCAVPSDYGVDFDDEDDESEHIIARTKKIAVKPMSVEEAILQMEMLGHTFFMFRDQEIDDICVVYRRNDGKYALIEPA